LAYAFYYGSWFLRLLSKLAQAIEEHSMNYEISTLIISIITLAFAYHASGRNELERIKADLLNLAREVSEIKGTKGK
jgi:hypothetical protein